MSNPSEREERTIELRFSRAVETIQNLPPPGGSGGSVQPSNEEKLKFYALYKQATVGDAPGARPSFYELIARAKWDAWNLVRGLSSLDAKQRYAATFIEFLRRFPDRPQAVHLLEAMEDAGDDGVSSEDGAEAFDYNNEIGMPSNSYFNLPPRSPRSSTTDEDTFLSTEEFNAALIARERAEEEEGDISDATIRVNQSRSQLPNSFFPCNPHSASSIPHSPSSYRALPSMPSAASGSILDNSKFITASTPDMLASTINQRGSMESAVAQLSESAEIALQTLQTEVAALNERIEILRREVEDREQAKKRAKRGARSLLKLCFKHAAVNCALFLLILAYLYRRRSPIAMNFLAHVAPTLVISGRVMVDRVTEVAGRLQGKVTRN